MIDEYEQHDFATGSRFRAQFLSPLLSFDLHKLTDAFIGDGWGISRCLFLSVLFTGLLSVLWLQIPNLPLFAFEWLLGTAPLWLPIVTLVIAWKVWIWYARGVYLFERKAILLEVKIPRDITRSPRAMENALSKLWVDSGETTFFNTAWQGHVRPYFSFEIASFGGDIHFYVWTWSGWRAAVESALYGYYPELEIVEVEDYASKFKYDAEKHECFATDWRYEPRNDAYPIKTYVDFELDKDPKEEYRVDPIAQVLERLSNLRPDEQGWLQIIITQSKDKRRKKGGLWWETESRYEGLVKEEVEKIRRDTAPLHIDDRSAPDAWKTYARVPLYRATESVKTIERNMGKHIFNVGVRGVYICDPAKFSAGGYTGVRWIWRPFGNVQYLNQLRPRRWSNPFDYPWQDWGDIRWTLMLRRFFDAYRRRSYFYSPWIIPHNMMSTEVIATLWHPPSASATAPGLQRIPAKKAEPPPNLPK
ncbi:MAG: hypothetical protein Q7S50_00865 [bacterium]|nr:hypothetical protein [bacterium]